jgi:hypothetical protein
VASNGPVVIRGTTSVRGAVRAGPGHEAKVSKHCQVSEPVRPLTARLDIPAVKLDPFAHDSANDVLPATFYRDGDLRVPAAHSLALPGGVYYLRNLVVSAGARLRLNGPVTFLVSGEVSVEGAIETIGARPAHCRVRVTGDGRVAIQQKSDLFIDVYAPRSLIELYGAGEVFGSLVGKSLRVIGDRGLHVDESLAANRAP